ncbi:hypothetical protein ACFQ9X_36485 [Catenulispora yoronensis]
MVPGDRRRDQVRPRRHPGRGALGYGNAVPSQLPPTTVAMLPTGPALDEADAQKPVAVPGS